MKVAKKSKEIPSWYRETLQLKQKGRREDVFLPMALQIMFDKLLCERIHGESSEASIREALRSKNIVIGMQKVIDEYNARIKVTNKKILKENKQVLRRLDDGEITPQEASRPNL